MPLPIGSAASVAPGMSDRGVAFAEVSADFCFYFNTRCHSSIVFTAAGWIRYRGAGGMYAGCVGVGTVKRFYLSLSASMAGATVRRATGAYVAYVAAGSSYYAPALG